MLSLGASTPAPQVSVAFISGPTVCTIPSVVMHTWSPRGYNFCLHLGQIGHARPGGSNCRQGRSGHCTGYRTGGRCTGYRILFLEEATPCIASASYTLVDSRVWVLRSTGKVALELRLLGNLSVAALCLKSNEPDDHWIHS